MRLKRKSAVRRAGVLMPETLRDDVMKVGRNCPDIRAECRVISMRPKRKSAVRRAGALMPETLRDDVMKVGRSRPDIRAECRVISAVRRAGALMPETLRDDVMKVGRSRAGISCRSPSASCGSVGGKTAPTSPAGRFRPRSADRSPAPRRSGRLHRPDNACSRATRKTHRRAFRTDRAESGTAARPPRRATD